MDQQWKAVAATSVLSPWSLKSLSKKIASLAIGCWMNHCSRWLFFFSVSTSVQQLWSNRVSESTGEQCKCRLRHP